MQDNANQEYISYEDYHAQLQRKKQLESDAIAYENEVLLIGSSESSTHDQSHNEIEHGYALESVEVDLLEFSPTLPPVFTPGTFTSKLSKESDVFSLGGSASATEADIQSNDRSDLQPSEDRYGTMVLQGLKDKQPLRRHIAVKPTRLNESSPELQFQNKQKASAERCLEIEDLIEL